MPITRDQLWTWGKVSSKLAIATTLAAVVAQLLNLEYPFYAAIAPAIVMGATRSSTLEAGVNRVKGTIVGTLVGAAFASTLGSNSWSLLFAVMASIFICHLLQLADVYRLAGYVPAIVILSHSSQPWLYAGERFVETCLGITAAIVVDDFLLPAKAAENLRKNIHQMLLQLCKFYQLVFECYITGEYRRKAVMDAKTPIIQSLRTAEKLWQEAKREQPGKLWVDETWEFLLRRTWEHVLTMDYAADSNQRDTFWQGIEPELNDLSEAIVQSFQQLAEAVATQNSRPQLPDLDAALSNAIQRLDQLQGQGDACYHPAELRRFFSFFYSMEEIVKKLKRMSNGL